MPDEEVPEPIPLTPHQTKLEQKQLMFRRRRAGNPNLKKGEKPYCMDRESFRNWLEDHPEYERKSRIKISEAIRRFLREPVFKNRPVSLFEGGTERFVKMMEALYKTAINHNSKNQIAAAQLLLAYGWGKPKAAEEDLKAIQKGGLTLVYVDRREIDPEIPVAPVASLPPAPEFVEGKFTEDAP